MDTNCRQTLAAALLVVFAAGCAVARGELGASTDPEQDGAPQSANIEGAAHGFPEMRTLEGAAIADGEYTQWIEGDRLHVKIRYEFGAGRSVEENSVIQQEPKLVQELWSWTEMRDGALHRRFEIDFLAGKATAEKQGKEGLRRWSKHVDVEPGRAFAGFAWTLAIRAHRDRLLRGETVRLGTVGFTPSPKAATVEISYRGLEQLDMAGRSIAADRFVIHPKIPWIARAFVTAPDSRLWLTNVPPAAFLRSENPLAEPDDRIIRVDLLPGESSAAKQRVAP